MSVLVDKNTRVVTQGITGKTGAFHTRACREYGTQMVAGVTPGKGGQDFEGIPSLIPYNRPSARRGLTFRSSTFRHLCGGRYYGGG